MLSLSSQSRESESPQTTILDLPAEIFHQIIEDCRGNARLTRELFPASLACKAFRTATLLFLFRHVTISISKNSPRKHREYIFDFLLRSPHICETIRSVTIGPFQTDTEMLHYPCLWKLLPQLIKLRKIRLEHSGLSHEKDLLQLLETLPSKPAICIKDFSTWLDPTQKGPAVWSTTLQNVKSLSFEDTLYNLPKCLEVGKNTLDHLKVLHAAFPNLESLGLYFDSRTLSDHLQHSSSTEGSSSSTAIYLPPLRKLHLYGIRGYLKPEHGTYGNIIQAIEWSTIEKLTLTNDFLVQAILPRVGLKMVCLRSLKVAIHPIDGTGRWLCEDQTLQDLRDFLAMTKVVELELYGFPKSLPISEIVSPRLRKLCLHAWEIGRRGQNGGESHLRTSHDIRQLAELAPNIEHLMIDISYMQQIWRPSANPDTVIDPDLLQVFEAIAGLSCLKILHLFPRYCRWNQHGFLDSWQQALKDDGQAVETFRFLKAKRPSLELLLLTSDNFLCTISWINPMSWRVSRLGNDTLLTTRQAGHDCEQRQIWSGTRKLRAEMKKDAFIKSYLDGVGPRRCGIRRPFV